jgi:hypothetical protein
VQRVQQSIIQSPAHDADTFALAVWVGTIGGAALGTDPAPNTTPPSAGRILTLQPRPGTFVPMGASQLKVICGVVAASTITFQMWFFDVTPNLWVQYSAPTTITPTGAVTNLIGFNVGNLVGAPFFVQITANTLVQALGYDYQ